MKRAYWLAIVLVCSFCATAQEAYFRVSADTLRIAIGEAVELVLEGGLPAKAEKPQSWPVWPDTVKGLVIAEVGPIDTATTGGLWRLSQKMRITSFDSGYLNLPALRWSLPNDSLISEPLQIWVDLPEVKEEQDFFDIKDPLAVKPGWWYYGRWVALALGIGLLAWLIYYFVWRRKKGLSAPRPSAKPLPPPDQEALTALDALAEKKLWQQGQVKAYYSELIDILRNYLERRFGLQTKELTASQLQEKMAQVPCADDTRREIRLILATSALVKFAKAQPLAEENEAALRLSRQLIEETRKKPEDDSVSL